ncbi:plasmid mobilization protein [Streptococcus ovuberis]|uniref:MobC family plasmid mobilization relaxosome protein n=1 Tax=Streptococcus ovuberis TaxID=1936207 RepID=A0A7X6S0U2_9STRE|nr:plasmid mobilization relaxosome protein MobC [Streptococcus ovuberis]NKZ19685.1 MobC family plasmid mobilization relaxosome protein [Streptococcus ovuberis]
MDQKSKEVRRSRSVKKEFFVDETEEKIIRAKMAEHNLRNFSTFARKMLLTGEVKVINFEELRLFRQEIKRIGVNVNQVAKQVNTDDEVSVAQITQVYELLKEVNDRMNQVLKRAEEQANKE